MPINFNETILRSTSPETVPSPIDHIYEKNLSSVMQRIDSVAIPVLPTCNTRSVTPCSSEISLIADIKELNTAEKINQITGLINSQAKKKVIFSPENIEKVYERPFLTTLNLKKKFLHQVVNEKDPKQRVAKLYKFINKSWADIENLFSNFKGKYFERQCIEFENCAAKLDDFVASLSEESIDMCAYYLDLEAKLNKAERRNNRFFLFRLNNEKANLLVTLDESKKSDIIQYNKISFELIENYLSLLNLSEENFLQNLKDLYEKNINENSENPLTFTQVLHDINLNILDNFKKDEYNSLTHQLKEYISYSIDIKLFVSELSQEELDDFIFPDNELDTVVKFNDLVEKAKKWLDFQPR